jgi:hypothetical protein
MNPLEYQRAIPFSRISGSEGADRESAIVQFSFAVGCATRLNIIGTITVFSVPIIHT